MLSLLHWTQESRTIFWTEAATNLFLAHYEHYHALIRCFTLFSHSSQPAPIFQNPSGMFSYFKEFWNIISTFRVPKLALLEFYWRKYTQKYLSMFCLCVKKGWWFLLYSSRAARLVSDTCKIYIHKKLQNEQVSLCIIHLISIVNKKSASKVSCFSYSAQKNYHLLWVIISEEQAWLQHRGMLHNNTSLSLWL